MYFYLIYMTHIVFVHTLVNVLTPQHVITSPGMCYILRLPGGPPLSTELSTTGAYDTMVSAELPQRSNVHRTTDVHIVTEVQCAQDS